MIHEDDVIAAAARLGGRLREVGWSVATVESCTGGLIACALTETAGSSAWFDRGFVTYSNESKTDLVGVLPTTLHSHGAVSEPTAREMARGGLEHSRARLAMSVTGIAGPGGAVPGKPVGTVCFGWAARLEDGRTLERVETVLFDGGRSEVRRAAALHALAQALSILSAETKD
ncbi:MAG: hypothetical protein RIS35_840 [Pseudomonadota bacterium]